MMPETKTEPIDYDKTAMNDFVTNLYDEKMREGKHGHYETLYSVVHAAIHLYAIQMKAGSK